MSQVRPILDVRELRVEYMSPSGPVVAADNVSFHIDPGEVYGLAGESGCGKSTVALALLRVLGRTQADLVRGTPVWIAIDMRRVAVFCGAGEPSAADGICRV